MPADQPTRRAGGFSSTRKKRCSARLRQTNRRRCTRCSRSSRGSAFFGSKVHVSTVHTHAKEHNMTTTTLTRTRPGAAIAVAWVLQILCAAMFLFAGGSKLAAQQAMVDTFGLIGLGQWFR